MPFNIENKPGFLKIMVDYDYPMCKNCPVPIRLRYYYSILIAHHKQILVNGDPIHIDSLYASIKTYLSNVGNENGYFPEDFNQVNFKLIWNADTQKVLIESVLNQIYKAQLDFVENKISNNSGLNFCKLSDKEIGELKEKYPLRIEFDLGMFRLNAPPNKTIEIDDKNLILEDIEPVNEL
ncbi:hypothetical protein [Draconibacterium sediminis]|uniref:hypothetical protein n=1 Tax=Draconibacterium sediminis TaxID=1544798 RepID=UPI0026F09941|nr:hypothetical protein [Draconibacterium sediminis]